MNKLSVVIITLNEEYNIKKCLDSVKDIANEIVVVDSFSTDKTEEICKQYDDLVFIQHKFENYGKQKQFAINQASNDLIFSIDADESLSKDLITEIKAIKENELQFNGYYIRRQTFYQGKVLQFCGMHSEKHLRLFNRKEGKISDVTVHEKFLMNLSCGILKNKMIHYPYRNLAHHLEKINQYTSLFAKENANKKPCSKTKVFTKCSIRFFTIYFIKLAILDGYSGFIWAVMGSYYSFLKYAKISEIQKLKSSSSIS